MCRKSRMADSIIGAEAITSTANTSPKLKDSFYNPNQ